MSKRRRIRRDGARLSFLVAAMCCLAVSAVANVLPSAVSMRPVGTNLDGHAEFVLEWDSLSNATYRVHQRESFDTNSPWIPIDLLNHSSGRAEYRIVAPRTQTSIDQGFFRLELPSPEIYSIEPALVGTNGGVITLLGQCLGTNTLLRIGGRSFGSTLIAPGEWTFEIPGGLLGEGVYDVEVLDGTNVVSTASKLFSVTGQPTPVGEAAGRQFEPPLEPPASPTLMKAKEKANRTKCSNNLRTIPATGEIQVEMEDLHVAGRGLDFTWTRTYRSRNGRNTRMGHHWSHSYDLMIVQTNGGVAVSDGTGRIDLYHADTNGNYTCDEIFNTGTFSNGAFILEFPDTSKWIFNPGTHPLAPNAISRIEDRLGNALTFSYDGSARLTEVIDTLGRTNRVAYNGAGRIESVTDFTGRTVTYSYWANGETGGGSGDLRSVTSPPVTGTPHNNDFPQGKTITFTYSTGFAREQLNHNLLTITDGKGQSPIRFQYADATDPLDVSFDRVHAIHRGSHPATYFSYARRKPQAKNGWAVLKAIQNDPEGNVTIDWFNSRHQGVIHRDLAARAVPGTVVTDDNLPTTKPFPSDPDFWETTYQWNVDSLCTRVTFPRGNSTEFVYQRTLDHNSSRSNKSSRRSDGNPRVIRERACCGDVDGDGSADVADLVWRMEFDPRFGSPAYACSASRFASGPRQSTSLDGSFASVDASRIRPKGWDGTIKGNLRRINSRAEESYQPWDLDTDDGVVSNPLYEQSGNSGVNPLYEGSHSALRTVDPRGVVELTEYNERGIPLSIRHGGFLLDGSDAPATSFEYYPNGQLAAVVHPQDGEKRRRRDEFLYAGTTDHLRTWIVDATGPSPKVTQYEHDTRANVTAWIDPRGHTNSFIYNQLDQLVERQTPDTSFGARIATFYTYDANNNLTQVELENRDDRGVLNPTNAFITSTFTYDALNRPTLLAHELTHVVQQRNGTQRLVYDGVDNVVEHHTPEAVNGNQPDAIVHRAFDVRRLLRREIHAPGSDHASTDLYDYDANGQLSFRSLGGGSGSGGLVLILGRDGFGRCISATDGMGNVQSFGYDANHNVIWSRFDGETNDVPGPVANRRLSETWHAYDSLNRPVTRRDAFFDVATGLPLLDGDATTTFSYSPNGARIKVTDDNGNATTYAYDSAGRVASVTDAKLNQVSYTYDGNDNVLTATQTDRADLGSTTQTFVSTCAYDPLNRRILDFDNVGNTNRYAYDSRNNLTRHTDPRGNDVCRVFDGLGRCTTTISYVGSCDAGITINTSHVEYDDNSRVTTTTDGNSNSTHFGYDPLGRCISTTHADGTGESLVWSPRSNLRQRTDANNTVITFTYDDVNRCVRKDIVPGAGVAAATTFETFAYDGLSRMVVASNDASMIEFTWDSLGNIVKQKQDCIAMIARFDALGNRTSVTYPSERVVEYGYDALSRITNVASAVSPRAPLVNLAAFAYEGSRLSRIARANGINTRLSYSGDIKTQNAAGDFGWQQVSLINHQRAGGNTVVDRRALAYDPLQNKSSRTQLVPFVPGQDATTNVWNYDALSQLRMAIKSKGTGAQIHEYELDANGNRKTTTGGGGAGSYTMSADLPEPGDFQMDQYTTSPFGSHAYDRNGNLVSIPGPIGSTDFHYDYANRLTSVTRTVGPAAVPVVSYTYDALGSRISKTVFPAAPEAPVTTVYYLDRDDDGDGVIEETENGTLKRTVVFPHVLETSGTIQFTSDGHSQWTICDELGTALALVNEAGEVLERYDYDDFGAPQFLNADGAAMTNTSGLPITSSPAGNRHLFRGMEWEAETSLYTVGPVKWMPPESLQERRWNSDPYAETLTRFYDPSLGRFISGRSCASSRSGISLGGATFAGNNPWSRGGGGGGTVLFNPREYSVSKMEGGRHTPFHNKYRPSYAAGRIAGDNTPIIRGSALGGLNKEPQAVGLARVITAREAGSGLATGRRSRETGSGIATGRRTRVMPHVLEVSGSILNAREAGSGLATGRRSREAGSGLATGRRSGSIIILDNDGETEVARYNFFEAWPCRWKAPELNSHSDRWARAGIGHTVVIK